MKRMVVLIGNYGSGKTEIALNLAINAAREGKKAALWTLISSILISGPGAGFAPSEKRRQADRAAVCRHQRGPSRAFRRGAARVCRNRWIRSSSTGTRSARRPWPVPRQIRQNSQRCRGARRNQYQKTLCATAEDISALLAHMSAGARLSIDGIINNANLARDSEARLLLESEEILKK